MGLYDLELIDCSRKTSVLKLNKHLENEKLFRRNFCETSKINKIFWPLKYISVNDAYQGLTRF